MKPFTPLILALSFLFTSTHAQDPIGLYLASRYGGSPLEIRKLSMDVTVSGDRAVTTLDFTFYNKMDHLLEGDFKFPLESGQSVYHLALEIGNHLREASIVEKNQGRRSFEAIARRKVDPALLEKTAGNIYTTKIYPIPRKGTRRVVIGLEETLGTMEDAYSYRFPLNFSGVIEHFNLSVSRDGQPIDEVKLADQRIPMAYSESDDHSTLARSKFEGRESLEILFPREQENNPSVYVEMNRSTGETFFSTQIPLKNPDKGRSPKNILLLWDTSFSGIHRDHEGDVDIVLNYLQTVKRASVELLCFDLEAHRKRSFRTNRDGLEALKKDLQQIQYDGATRWNSLNLEDHSADRIILVSDGISTLGAAEPKLPNVPLYVLNSSVKADHEFLDSLCQKSGGLYINTRQRSREEALEKLKIPPLPIESIEVLSGDVETLVSKVHRDSEPHLWIAGKLLSEQADLKIIQKLARNRTSMHTFSLQKGAAQRSRGMIERAWARAAFATMPRENDKDRAEAVQFAKKHKIVTTLTSLIVLELVSDYVHYKVDPPKDLLEEYKRALEYTAKEPEFDPSEKLDEVVSLWEERIEWYEMSFNDSLTTKGSEPVELGVDRPKETSIPWARPAQWDQPFNENEEDPEEIPFQVDESSIDPPTPEIVLTPPHSHHYDKTQDENGDEVYSLSPFMIEEDEGLGYTAVSTLAGTRIRANLKDVASHISVSTDEFVADMGATEISDYAGTIEVAGPVSDEAYYDRLRSASNEQLVSLYFELRKDYSNAPSFFFDAASIFQDRGKTMEATRALSSVLDLAPGDYLFQRAVGRTLVQLGTVEYGIEALEATKEFRNFEPQSYFDLGMALAAAGRNQEAIEMLYQIVTMPGTFRFDEIEVIALMEINRILQLQDDCLDSSFIDERLVYAMPMDLRITLSWNTDDTDVDLHVTNPKGQKCYYVNQLTREGGLLSRDITEGYGPEEFLLKQATKGTYTVQAHYFGTDEQGQLLPVILSVQITKNFGRASEETETVTLRLEEEDDLIHLGDIVL